MCVAIGGYAQVLGGNGVLHDYSRLYEAGLDRLAYRSAWSHYLCFRLINLPGLQGSDAEHQREAKKMLSQGVVLLFKTNMHRASWHYLTLHGLVVRAKRSILLNTLHDIPRRLWDVGLCACAPSSSLCWRASSLCLQKPLAETLQGRLHPSSSTAPSWRIYRLRVDQSYPGTGSRVPRPAGSRSSPR